jgi:hypothetical protein
MSNEEQPPERVDCHEYAVGGGKIKLVFTSAVTGKSVGEMLINADSRYLVVMSRLFTQYVTQLRSPLALPAAVHNILNGTRPANH